VHDAPEGVGGSSNFVLPVIGQERLNMTRNNWDSVAARKKLSLNRLMLQVLLVGAAFNCPSPVEASVIYSNLGPNDSFSTTPGVYPIWNLVSGGFIDRAASFTVPGLQDVLFGSAELGFHLQSGNNAASVHLAADDAGLPGAVIETINILLPAPSATPTIVTATSNTNPTLTAGLTYWIIASMQVPGSMATWGPNNTGALGGNATRTNFQNGQWFSQGPGGVPSLRVNSAEPAAVPEPASLLLLGSGLAGAAARRYRRGTKKATSTH
jgi:hypothetical protein